MEAHIVGGDAEYVYVGPKEAPEAIPRSTIKDIDYAGTGMIWGGSFFTALGLAELLAEWHGCMRNAAGDCLPAVITLAASVPMVLGGLVTRESAVNAAHSGPPKGASLGVAPVVGTERGEPTGAVLVGAF
jgi:hypothetical protein